MQELTPSPEAGGVYIHIPFCLKKCLYCDFYSITDRALIPPFLQALEKEMRLSEDRLTPYDTLYLGGGTPSLLDPLQVARIVERAARSYRMLSGAEITLEINPGTVDLARISGYRSAGVSRINIGIQSFSDPKLSFLGRIHTAREAARTIAYARRAGFDNIGLDLIYGLPGQSEADWMTDLQKAVAHRPEHLSCYMLTYEDGTPLDRLRRQKRVRPLGEERVAALFQLTIDFLSRNGYRHYEISNFAAADRFKSRHNCKYWNFSPYVGLGPSAHAYLPPARRWNRADVTGYIRDIADGKRPLAGEEVLTRRQEMIEAVYLGLRQAEGISLARFEKCFGEDFRKIFAGSLPELVEDGLLQTTSERCALTRRGMLFLDTVAGRLVSELA